MALRWFRDRARIEALGRDSGISRATAYRYIDEAVDVLSEQAPTLAGALGRALADGVPYVILDGKVFKTDVVAARENAASPCSPAAGPPASTSPQAPAGPPRLPAPPSS
jgi:hypothetical protein